MAIYMVKEGDSLDQIASAYGKDPLDSNIRIAPSYPPLDDLKLAAELFTVCVRYISIKKILENRAEEESQQ